jgi:hypothetical protein
MSKKVVYVSTRRFEGDDPVKTKLTIDMDSLTEAEKDEYVIDSATIKWQASIRRKKDATVPTEATYIVPKPGTRASAAMLPFDALVMICAGNKEQALGIVEKAGSVEKALELFKGVLADFESEG